jgi:uncharacterized protein
MDLSAAELRVLGCLIEKELTTPQQYPLTLNALMLACNQTSNRDPVVDYDEATVDEAVRSIKTKGLASFVHPSHGRSALRVRHTLGEVLGLDVRPLALLAVLVLRGPQTPGELRARTERMVRFSDLAEIQAELDSLAGRAEALVLRLRREPGQKEDRYSHLLGTGAGRITTAGPQRGDVTGTADVPTGVATAQHDVAHAPTDVAPAPTELAELRTQLNELRAQLIELRAEIAQVCHEVDELNDRLAPGF